MTYEVTKIFYKRYILYGVPSYVETGEDNIPSSTFWFLSKMCQVYGSSSFLQKIHYVTSCSCCLRNLMLYLKLALCFSIIIPFPQKGNGILFLCGFIFAIIIIIIFDVVVVVVKIPSFFKISQWNLVGTWVMGLIAYIMMYDRICHAVMELWQKMC